MSQGECGVTEKQREAFQEWMADNWEFGESDPFDIWQAAVAASSERERVCREALQKLAKGNRAPGVLEIARAALKETE